MYEFYFCPIQYSQAVSSGPSTLQSSPSYMIIVLSIIIFKRLQKIRTACAYFFVGKLVERDDDIKLN